MSVHKIVQDYSPLGTWIIDNYWDNEASILDMAPNTPLLIIHGLDDEIINVIHGKTLFDKYESKFKMGYFPSESYHNEFYIIDVGRECDLGYCNAIFGFFENKKQR